MAKITISDLHFSSDPQILNELNDWEMKTIEGGVVSRRQPIRNRAGSTTTDSGDTSDVIAGTLDDIDGLLSNLRLQIGETMYNLRTQLRNI